MKSTFIKLQKESLSKDIGQELLIVNNSVLTCPIFFVALSQWRDLWSRETVARDLKYTRSHTAAEVNSLRVQPSLRLPLKSYFCDFDY